MLRYLPLLFALSLAAQFGVKYWKPVGVGNTAARPATCTANRDTYINTQTSAIDYCTAANTWTALTSAGGGVTTGVTLTADLPVIGAGSSAVAIGTRQGNTTKYTTYAGSAPSTNDCAKFDANGNLTTAGAACGTSTGLGDPGSNGIVYRDSAGTSTVATATEMAGPNNCADAGSNDTYACTLSPAPSAYTTRACYVFTANTANTGAATINFNSLGAKTIKKVAGGITTDLADNDIRSGQVVTVCYDGTNMQMQSTLGNAASGGGSSNTYGTYASLSGTCTTGDTYRTSDSVYEFLCTATNTWTAFHKSMKVVVPPSSGWSWVNQDSATETVTAGTVLMADNASNDGMHLRCRTAPATPYTITARLSIHGEHASAQSPIAAVAIRDSTGGKLVSAAVYLTKSNAFSSPALYQKWTTASSFSAEGGQIDSGRVAEFLRVSDNGTTTVYSASWDGLNFYTLLSEGRTTFMAAPDQVCWGVRTESGALDMRATLISWDAQ